MSRSPLFGAEIKELQSVNEESGDNAAPAAPQNPPEDFNAWSSRASAPSALNFRPPQFKPSFALESEPHTPVEQIPSPFFPFNSKNRFGSVSSIATTDDDEMGGNEIIYPWNDQQDELVKSMYEELLNSPQLTPFSGRYPPSGVLHRVAKDTLRMAKHRQIYFPHSMNAVRQRVIYFYHTEPETREELQKYKVSNENFPMSSDPATDLDDFDFTDTIGASGRRFSVDEKYGHRQSLQPAFKEPAPRDAAQQGLSEESVINIVAKRKRDSLRMKRGPH